MPEDIQNKTFNYTNLIFLNDFLEKHVIISKITGYNILYVLEENYMEDCIKTNGINEERLKKAKRMKIFISFAAGMAGLLFGLDIGVISGALPFITTHFELSSRLQEWVVSTMMLGAALGAISTGWISFRLGRKKSLMTGAALFVLGSLGCALAPNVGLLLISRVMLGFAVGIASYVAPLYLSEMAEKEDRGKLISMYQMMVTIGILVAFVSDTIFSYGGHWRMMLGVISIPALLLMISVFGLPDSPRWLASKGKFSKAKEVLLSLSSTDEKAENELLEINESLKVKQEGWGLFKSNKNVRRAVYLGMLLQAMQQFTGMNVILYYAPQIFKHAGFANTEQQMIATVICGLTNTLATLIAMKTVDKQGRKPILTIGFAGIATGTFLLGVCLYMINAGFSALWISIAAIVMTLFTITSFAMSAGPVVWILCSEIQPLKSRDFGVACSTTTNWIVNMIIGATFLTLINAFGIAATFWIYTGLNLLFILLTVLLIPETKGISLEKIEKNLMDGKRLRDIGV